MSDRGSQNWKLGKGKGLSNPHGTKRSPVCRKGASIGIDGPYVASSEQKGGDWVVWRGGLGDSGSMEMGSTEGLATALLGMQRGKLQFEVGVRVAARAMDVAREQGEAMEGLVTAAAKVMGAGQKALEKGIEGTLNALDVYA